MKSEKLPSSVSSTQKIMGLVGSFMCLIAFVTAMTGSAFVSIGYTQEFQARCGYIAASVRASSLVYGFLVGSIGFVGCTLASRGGFTSRWWRFFCNVTIGLCAFTVLFTFCLR
jgi:hypothetical protein